MPKPIDRQEECVNQAADLAQEVAPDLDVLLTHYADAEMLDTLRPGETDLQTVRAVTRAAAPELLQVDVELLVQRADRAAFRRWMSDRKGTVARLGGGTLSGLSDRKRGWWWPMSDTKQSPPTRHTTPPDTGKCYDLQSCGSPLANRARHWATGEEGLEVRHHQVLLRPVRSQRLGGDVRGH